MRTPLSITEATNHGAILSLSPVDIINGNSFINDGHTVLGIFNPDPSVTLSVTIEVGGMVDTDIELGNRIYSVPPLATLVIGRLQPELYNQLDRAIWIDFSIATALIAVVSFA